MVNKPLPGKPGEPDNQIPADKEYSTTLPYEQLPGEGLNSFELLCFRVLMAEKKTPHFFARKGQRDYGVDIRVIEDNDETTVYQCKNEKGSKDKLNESDFKKAFDKFYNDWVREQKLPVPNRFFYCTSVRIAKDKDSHSNFLTASEDFKKQFLKECRQPLQVDFWDRTDLDEKLKYFPDIVSEMFGAEAAARHCGFYGWDSDIVINVREDGGRDRFLQEYFKKKERIYIPPHKREELDKKIKEHRKVLICGFPGTGKTSLALALAEGFSVGPSSELIPPYVYYVNFKREINPDSFRKGIQQRGFLPTVFIFDDCQENTGLAVNLSDTLDHMAGEKQQVFCIFLLRTTLTREERRDEDANLRELFEPDAIIDYAVDKRLFQEIAASLKPGLMGIDYNALFHLSGGDLFILDFILEKVDTAGDINAWKEEKGRCELYQKAIDTYFKGERRSLGKILGLLVLAQFDIGIHPEYYDRIYGSILQESMKKILLGLVVTAGTPAQCYFLHSSLAELLCRAAVQAQGGGYIETVTRFSLEYFKHIVEAGVDTQEFNGFLAKLIPAKLKLKEKTDEEKKIKIGFLQRPVVLAAMKDRFDWIVPNIIAGVLRLVEGQEVFSDYFAVLKEKIESGQYSDTVIFYECNWVGSLLRFLKEKYPGLFDQLKTKVDAERIKILCEIGNFQGLVNFIKNSFDIDDGERLNKVLEQLGEKDIEQIVERSIREGRSIGTLNLGLRELQEKGLLQQWECKVSPAHYLKLITANGTISELIKFLEHSTVARAGELVDALSEDVLQELIAKTMASGRSIGTLDLGLRELQTKGLLEQWERKVSPAHYLKLIAANGTIFELIRFLQRSTVTRAGELIDALTENVLQDLIAKTMASGRSIGTLNLGLRELQTKGLMEQWERKVSPVDYLKLTAANGTIFELIGFLQRSTAPRAGELIDALSEDVLRDLIAKTIASGRSIGTLNLGFRELQKKGVLEKWERKVSPAHYLKLITANGTIFELIKFLEHSTVARAGELIDALTEDVLQELIAKTIALGRSIGTLHMGLRELQEKGLLQQWERKVRPGYYLSLIAANGTFVDLIKILEYSTEAMVRNLMQCISREWAEGVIKKTITKKPSLTSLHWGLKRMLRLTGNDSRLFDEKIGLDNLFHLIITIGNPAILIQILDNLPKSMQQTLIEASRSLPAEKKTAFILQWNIYHFCAVAAHYPQLIISPGETGPNLERLTPIVTQLIESSDFFSLSRGISCLEEITHPEFKALVLEQVARRLDLLPLEKVDLTSNTEKVYYLALLNRLEKLDVDTLNKVVPTIDRKTYVKEKYFFNSQRHLFQVLAAHETEISSSLRQEMLDLGNGDLIPGILDKQDLLPIFLYLWNTYALFITVQDKRQFNQWLNPSIKEAIFKSIEKNKNLRSLKPEYEHLLMLVGLLAYLKLQPTRLRAIFNSSFQLDLSPRYLRGIVEKRSFIIGCFFLKGVEFFLRRPVYTEYWELVNGKREEYKVQTRALRELMDLL